MTPSEPCPPKAQGACARLVIIEGDPDCEHTLCYHGMSSREGMTFAEFECVRCGRVIAQRSDKNVRPDAR